MAVEKLKFGDALAGILIDGEDGTPYVGSTLHMEEPDGPVVEVPYIQGDATGQFRPVQEWFSNRKPPENLILKTAQGEISLFDVRWMGHSVKTGGSVSSGKLEPAEIVLSGRDAALSDPLLVSEMRSHLDGLKQWSGYETISQDTERNEKGRVRKLKVEVESVAAMTWTQGNATMTIQTDWRTVYGVVDEDDSFIILEWVVLDSKFDAPTTFFDHLVEQQKVQHLLILMFDGAMHFRKHRVRDATFTQKIHGSDVHNPFVELISRRTVREYTEKRPTKKQLGRPSAYMREIGVEGMQRWADSYDKWRRFILPTVGVLGRQGAFVEDVIVSLSMGLEAGGQLLGKCEGEEETYAGKRKTTATYVYRCLHTLNVDWGERVESLAGLARAMADTYNGIKHFDRGAYPDAEHSYLSMLVMRQMIRLMTLNLVDLSGELMRRFREKDALWRIHENFSIYELRITDKGKWEHQPEHIYGESPVGMTLE
jgi:hypothetical protein